MISEKWMCHTKSHFASCKCQKKKKDGEGAKDSVKDPAKHACATELTTFQEMNFS